MSGQTLIAAKWAIPDPVSGYVGRPRLTARLDDAIRHRLTVVFGPAGAGKTALAADWARAPGAAKRPAWLTVDRFDTEPEALWAYATAALHSAVGGAAEAVRAGPHPGELTLAALAGRISESPERIAFIVDNAEDLTDDQAHELVAGLLRPGLSNLHLVLLTRRQLPLSLGRLLLAGEVTEIGADELAFTTAEAERLCATLRPALDRERLEQLLDRTGGLAAAVVLAADPGQGSPAVGGDDPLAAFVRSEIYQALPPQVREFLLRGSVADEISSGLVSTLTGRRDTGGVMDILRDSGLIERAGQDGAAVRVRQPLLGFLRAEARRTIGNELRGLHARAARHLAGTGDALAAAEQAVLAGDWGYASRLLVRHAAPKIAGHEAPRLRRVLTQIPAAEAAHRPEAAAALALLRADQGSPAGVAAFAQLASQRLGQLPTERGFPVRALLDAIEMMMAAQRGEVGTLRTTANGIIALLESPDGVAIPAAQQLASMARNAVGTAELWAGRTGDAETAIRQAIETSERDSLEFVTADGLGKLAFLDALSGELKAAEERARTALRLLERAGSAHRSDAVLCWVALGLTHWLRGDSEQAGQCLRQAEAACPESSSRNVKAGVVAVLRAHLLMSARNAPAARAALADAETLGNGDGSAPLLTDWIAVTKSALHLTEHRPINALTTLDKTSAEHGSPVAHRVRVMVARSYLGSAAPARALHLLENVQHHELTPWAEVEAWLVRAVAAERLGRDGTARIALAEAVTAAAAEGLVEPLVDADPDLRAVMAANPDLLAQHEAIVKPKAPRDSTAPEPDHITQREAAVLRYLPTLLTRNDIARELSLSPNTVKAHLRSVYHKLGANTRREAVDRARSLGLLTQNG